MRTFTMYVAFLLVLLFSVVTEADQRNYVWTVEYLTLPKGGAEVEYWFTAKTEDIHQAGDTNYEHQIEIEYGITDRWDVSLYQMFKQKGKESLKYSGIKIETRYRFGERGQYPVDPLIYIEYKLGATGEENTVESKLILAKDIGKLNIAYNQILEAELNNGESPEHEYAAGISYPLNQSIRVGAEGKGSYTEREHAIGPTISWVSGRFWTTIGAVFGLNKRTDDRQVRFIIGMPF